MNVIVCGDFFHFFFFFQTANDLNFLLFKQLVSFKSDETELFVANFEFFELLESERAK
jgi:hypothetical protein